MIQRAALLFERATLTVDGQPKQRRRKPRIGLHPAQRDLYSQIERRFRDAIRTARKAVPARAQRRAQHLNKRFRLTRRPLRYRGGLGILRNR